MLQNNLSLPNQYNPTSFENNPPILDDPPIKECINLIPINYMYHLWFFTPEL